MSVPGPFRNLFYSQRKVVAWTVLILSIVMVWCVFQRDAITEYFQSLEVRDKEKQRIEDLDRQVRRLEREARVLSSNEGFEREKVARKQHHLSKPGENVLYLQDPPHDDSVTTASH